MRRTDQLILASRRSTENQEYTATAGVQDEEFIQYLNDGQEEIQSLINSSFPRILMKEGVIQVVQNQEAYSLPVDVFLGTRLDYVEYSPSGNSADYYTLKKGTLKERLNGPSGNPSFYIRRNSELLIQPIPQQAGLLRVNYQKVVPRLDIRRATVLNVILGTNTITTLTLDIAQLIDSDALLSENYVTVVDKNGVVKMRSIPVTAIDTSTGVVTVDPSFTFSSGESIAAGDYLLRGTYSTTNSQLPDICEKYLLEYCNLRILVRDSSTDANQVQAIMSKVQQTLQANFADVDSDPDYVPILDGSFLGWDY